MTPYLNAFIRSIIEAITEFLPISSTGHLFLFSKYFPFEGINNAQEFDDLYDIFIQSGAILSVLVLYFGTISKQFRMFFQYLSGKTQNKQGYHFVVSILLGSAPIVVIGFLFKKYLDVIKQSESILLILASAWILGGITILLVEKWIQPKTEKTELSPQMAIIIGLGQCVALIPGVSRSAATILTARLFGLSREKSAEYSFFLAVPVLILASLYKLYKYKSILNSETLPLLSFGFVLSFLFCLVVIKLFLSFIKRYSFSSFGVYRILLGAFVLLVLYK